MAEYRRYWDFRRKFGKRYSYYAMISRKLNTISAQNEEVINKLKDIEELLQKKSADITSGQKSEKANS